MKTALSPHLSRRDVAFADFERDTLPVNIGSVGACKRALPFEQSLGRIDHRPDPMPQPLPASDQPASQSKGLRGLPSSFREGKVLGRASERRRKVICPRNQ